MSGPALNRPVACACKNPSHGCRLVVLTGGPGAGKTAVLEIVKKNFCPHVSVLPEAASIVFGGGFWRKESVFAQKAAQRAIFHVQRNLERLVEEEQEAAVALCDRGTLDGLAYWPAAEENFWSELQIDRKRELARYQAVIHLRSPSQERGYNHSNPVRIETAPEAARIDARIAEAWDGHPRRFFIESTDDFLEKAQAAVELIRNELPACCRAHSLAQIS
jgi:predicted ATPase